MRFALLPRYLGQAIFLLSISLAQLAFAQQAEDGAFFRLFLSLDKNRPDVAVDLVIDGKTVQSQVMAGQIHPFIRLAPGHHDLTIQGAGQKSPIRGLPLEIIPGTTHTLVLNNLLPATPPQLFTDPLPTGRRQTRLNVYHLDTQGVPIDVLTSKGGRVFSSLAPGSRASQGVNPVRIELSIARSGQTVSMAEREVNLSPGRSYSIFFMPEAGRANRMIVGEDVFPAGYGWRP